jgi:hypothetical protein
MFSHSQEEINIIKSSMTSSFAQSTNIDAIRSLINALKEPFKVTFKCGRGCCQKNIYKLFLFKQLSLKYDLVDDLKYIIFFWVIFINDINHEYNTSLEAEMLKKLEITKEKKEVYRKLDKRLGKVGSQLEKNIQQLANFNESHKNDAVVGYTDMYDMNCKFYSEVRSTYMKKVVELEETLKKFKNDNEPFTISHIGKFDIPFRPTYEIEQPSLSDFHLYSIAKRYHQTQLKEIGLDDNDKTRLTYNNKKNAFELTHLPFLKGETSKEDKVELYQFIVGQFRSCFITASKKNNVDTPREFSSIQSYLAAKSMMLYPVGYDYPFECVIRIDDEIERDGFHAIALNSRIRGFHFGFSSTGTNSFTCIIMKHIHDQVKLEQILPLLKQYHFPLHKYMFCSYCLTTVDKLTEDKGKVVNGRMKLKCGQCHEPYYCGKKCQSDDWKEGGHSSDCKKIPKLSVVVAK